MTGDWQRAALMPSWIRWLPCSHAYLTAVPDQRRFRRSVWDGVVPWDQAAWCDPGDVEDWVERAKKRHPKDQAEHAEEYARQHYARAVTLRANRIEKFTEICRRQGLAAPHTLGELFRCMVDFGLFELEETSDGDPWVRPHLTKNPLDVLPFFEDERESERRAQDSDWMVLAAITLRRKAESRLRPPRRRRTVRTTLTKLTAAVSKVAEIEVEPAVVERALRGLAGESSITVDGLPDESSPATDTGAGAEQPLRIGLDWPEFAHAYPYEDLPAPEHGV